MADRSISISLEAKVQGFVSGMRTAQQATNDFANRTASFARENEQHFDRVGKASMVFGGAILAGIGIAVNSFMEFDSAMSEVQASTHETSANMDLLRDAAVNAGADTAFSAKEAAKGIDELAKAGVSTKDILGGGLTGALSLAAAGSLGVGDAAEIAATAMTQFKLSGDKIPHLADLLAAGAGKAQGSVQDMGMALKQAGLVAASTGLTIEETTGGLAAFASAGLIGSDAGTSFKSMLQRLTPQSLEAKNKMTELGISAYDAQGKFIGLSKFSENLKTSMQNLTPEARNAAMGVMFGSDAVRAANVLYEQGAQGISDWTDKVNDAGYAAVTASIKQDNLAGDIEKLGGSFDSVLIKGGSGVAESMRGLVQGAEDMVDAFGKIPAPILSAGLGMAGMAGAALLVGGAVITTVPKFLEFKDSMEKIAPAGSKAGDGIRKVGKAAGVALAAVVALQIAAAIFTEKHTKSAEDYGQALLKVGKAAGTIDTSGLDSIMGKFDSFAGTPVSNIDNMADAVARLTHQNFDDAGNKFFEGFTNFIGLPKGEIGQLEDRLNGLGDAMGNLVKNGASETAAKSFQALTKEFEKNGKGAKEALEALPGYKDALLAQASAAGVVLEGQDLLDFAMGKIPASMAGAAGAVETYTTAAGTSAPVTEDMAKALEEVGLSAEGAVTDIDAFAKSLFAAGLLSLSSSDAAIGYQDAIDKMTESVTKNGTTLDLNTEKGRANQSAFNGLAQAAMTSAQASAAETLATQGSSAAQAGLQGALRTSYNDLVRAAGQLGKTGDEADTMARKALGIPKNVNIDAWIADHATGTLDAIRGKADGLDGKTINLFTNIHETTFLNTVRSDSVAPTRGTADKRKAAYATGGRVYGPGTTTSDSIDARLSKDEYVLTAAAAKKIGYATLDAWNGGDTQPIKAGRQYAPASAPARQMPSASSSNVNVAAPAVAVYIGNEQLDARTYRVASSVVSAADRQSTYARPGRR
ncbi:phage tail tape measure protein [Arthrobacter sp. ES3-54]|uniref:phage tail tape measure protein n=1 Tax=Arthrobacter sp. ES3-54 TaxID=1502991 RepID=UPI00240590FE|nr:phage tail tape measure protein [Arthrobacter sp. ES3-54]MDF9748624.1 TP901 family phage tail tape measure protein [Arthrobacter sp. ES3-54]